ncbi:MAG: hypothetical protein QOK04_684, partial [Solirubrobacteraceae bacterium]|nr:hypothetical protein [Solirubrobacteraceae bacterium]
EPPRAGVGQPEPEPESHELPAVVAEYARYALGGTEPAAAPDTPPAPSPPAAPPPDTPAAIADEVELPAPARPRRRRAPSAPEVPSERSRPWLARALPQLAYEDPVAAASLAIELLPAQALAVQGRLNYDLVVDELGCHHVTIDARRGSVVKRRQPRSRIEVDFRIETDAAGLVELLVGGGSWRLRRRGVRVRATRRKTHALRALPPTPLRLAELARAAIWPDPGQLYRALAYVIEPEWTRGHHFTVALEISGSKGGTWYLVVDGDKRIAVVDMPPAGGATAAVRTSQATFQHLLDREPQPPEQKAAMKGDPRALALLTQWIEWAQGTAEPRGAASPD